MSDLLIRGLDDRAVRRIDANAARLGLSRNEYLKREIAKLAEVHDRSVNRDDLARSAELFADATDESLMREAWM